MKIKAVIMKPDRTNEVIKLRRKQVTGRTFTYGNFAYFLHPDRFQLTWKRDIETLWFRRYFATYYYKQGMANPLPVPNFQEMIPIKIPLSDRVAIEKNGGDPNTDFGKVFDNGISSEELASIFNPFLYRIIAAPQRSLKDNIQFFLIIGIGLAVAYLIFTTGSK